MGHQIALLVLVQSGPAEWRLLDRVARQVELLRPDEPLAVPGRVALNGHGPVHNGGWIEPRLLRQLPARGLDRGLPRIDPTAWRLPQQRSVVRIPPSQQQDSRAPVEADDTYRRPKSDLHPRRLV